MVRQPIVWVALSIFSISSLTLFLYGQDAHTNFQIEPLRPTQVIQLAAPLDEIKLPNPHSVAVPKLHAIILPSNRSGGSADMIARIAISMGKSMPEGSQLDAHTDFSLEGVGSSPNPIFLPGAILNNTPAEIQTRYGLKGSVGKSGLIVIVVANHYATAEPDLARFSTQFGLPSCSLKTGCLRVVQVDPVRTLPDTDPRIAADCGWAVEAALDLQWAHAIAPQAKLVLVEAASKSAVDLFQGVDLATRIAEQAGGGVVSMSWSFEEVKNELEFDSHFLNHDTVLYFAASGDHGGTVEYPSASPFVISVGGTEVARSNGNVVQAEEA
jgi:hypothetical protein